MSAPEALLATPAATEAELWRPIPDWPHEASTHGRIRRVPWIDVAGRLHIGGVLAQSPDKRPGKGYLYVTLRDGSRRRKAPVAVLVLEAHRERRPGKGYEACHGNGIRTDNCLPNLRWDTRAANLADKRRHQLERARNAGPAVTAPAVTERPFPQRGALRHGVTSRRYGDGPHGTGRFCIPLHFLSFVPSVNSALLSLRSGREGR